MNVTIPGNLINDLLNYLATKPYNESAVFIQSIEGLRNAQAKSARDAEIRNAIQSSEKVKS